MPERDPIAVVELPAQIDIAAAHPRAKVDEAAVGILHLDAELGHLAQKRLDLACNGIRRPPSIRGDTTLQVLEQRTHFGQQRIRLSARERRHMLSPEYPTPTPVEGDQPKGDAMATYVLLTKVSSAGIKTIQSNPRRIKEVNRDVEALGARVVAQYATLGRYDFVNIVEAKDAETIARISVALGARGTVSIETLTAIPVETFVRAVGRKGR